MTMQIDIETLADGRVRTVFLLRPQILSPAERVMAEKIAAAVRNLTTGKKMVECRKAFVPLNPNPHLS